MSLGDLAFLSTDVPAKNEISNSNFSEGTRHWGNGGSSSYVENQTLINTGSGSTIFPYVNQTVNVLNGHKYYFYVGHLKALNTPTSIDIRTNAGNGISLFSIKPNEPDEIYSISGVVESGFTGLSYYRVVHSYATTEDAKGAVLEVKYPLLIDLTETFGAGNEPTKEQMDTLLKQFPNSWFDDIINLFNAKHMVNIYHKEMTKLRTAITALGGSV